MSNRKIVESKESVKLIVEFYDLLIDHYSPEFMRHVTNENKSDRTLKNEKKFINLINNRNEALCKLNRY